MLVGTLADRARVDRVRARLPECDGSVQPCLGLGMMRTRKRQADAQANQPYRELSVTSSAMMIYGPGRAVVHGHAPRQTITTKDANQSRASSFRSLIRTSHQPQGKARMIVKHRQGIATTSTQGEITFEVHLPQVVGLWMDEADPRLMFKGCFTGQQMVTIQNAGDRTGAGYLSVTQSQQAGAQFPSTPRRMFVSLANHRFFDLLCGPRRRIVRTTRKFLQTLNALSLKSAQPLIGSGRTDSKLPAQLANIRFFLTGQQYKFVTLRHGGTDSPRHTFDSFRSLGITSKVFTMSPNTCLRSVRSIHRPLRGLNPIRHFAARAGALVVC